MSNWNLADIWECVAATVPDQPAQVQGTRRISWRDFDRRANALAADMIAAGLTRQSKVAQYLYNCPDYLESIFASFKGAFVPVNTNFRYGAEEILYLWDNADAEAVVFHTSFTALVEQVRPRLPRIRRWYAIEDGAPVPDWAVDYEALVAAGADRPALAWPRSGDDLLLLYTGGTTGMPKGVMWRQDDLFNVLGGAGNVALGLAPITALDQLPARIRELGAPAVYLPACPMMHGTGQFGAFIAMFTGGCVVALESRKFVVEELWGDVERLRINRISIVGDAFARPMLKALDAEPGRWDVSSVTAIMSSGVMWSQEVKAGLLRHLPQATLADSFGSSEAVGLGASASTAANAEQTARFVPGPTVRIFVEEDDWREARPGEKGLVGISGFLPAGYYKDAEKSERTFKVIRGVRYSVPGDFAQVNDDGTMMLLGRGSVCINTGGEKVFPEEVEEVLKRHGAIRDAVCVGVPDERFGQVIVAMIELDDGASDPGPAAVSEHVKGILAAYKAPRHAIVVPTIGRAANGKVDYKGLTEHARSVLGR